MSRDPLENAGHRVLVAALLVGCMLIGSFVIEEVRHPRPEPVVIVRSAR